MTENVIYVNKNTLEIESMRTEYSKTFYVSDTERKLVASRVPIHVKDKKGNWVDITCELKKNKVTCSPYNANLLKNKIGYQFYKDETKFVEMEIVGVTFKEPVVEKNVALWKDITPGVDIIIAFTATHVEMNIILKNKRARKTFDYRITAQEKLFEHVNFGGVDSKQRAVHLEQKEKSTKSITRKGFKLVEKIISNTFIPEVTEMNKKTRKRYWSKKVKYPVIIR